jgi:hypothetical protein
VEINPHGNSKSTSKSFSRTKPSTLKLIKKSVKSNRPLSVLRSIENKFGGVMNASSSCELPRDRRQIYNAKQKLVADQEKSLFSSKDTLACVMQKCKETALTGDAFIRSVQAAPEPLCVLATNQQLFDMERFCTSSLSCVLSVDPTFNLGNFYVTPVTYHNLLVNNKNGKHPIICGPILIHRTKTFEPFYYFATTLIGLNPNLVNLKSFGTDGELQLIKAFHTAFPNAVHLRCVNHLRQNVKDKLRSLGIPQTSWKEFLGDIFGRQIGSHFQKGLIDSDSAETFYSATASLEKRWSNLERSSSSSALTLNTEFHKWFLKYKVEDIIRCVLPEVRAKAGLDVMCKFTTNNSESLNNVIKQEVQWQESKLPVLIEHLQNIVVQHESELEKAVVQCGEWYFLSQYKHLEIEEKVWFTEMDAKAKEKHMKKVKNFIIETAIQEPTNLPPNIQYNSVVQLSIPLQSIDHHKSVSPTFKSIYKKTEELLSNPSNVIEVPWSSDKRSRLVKSSSSDHPHLVITSPKNSKVYLCDSNCAMFKGFNLCSHVLAAAESNGELKMFLESIGHLNPNLTAIANEGMPTGSGRKGGQPKRKRKAAVSIESISTCPSIISSVNNSRESVVNVTVSAPFPTNISPTTSHSAVSVQSPVTPSFPSATINANVSNSTQSAVNMTISAPFTPISGVLTAPFTQFSPINYPYSATTNTGTHPPSKPFILKFKTNLIKICQSCRKGFDGNNDTLGLVVSRMERRLISNMSTGVNYFGRESNSHYHCIVSCLKFADPNFDPKNLQVPESVKKDLTICQKIYLSSCFNVLIQ